MNDSHPSKPFAVAVSFPALDCGSLLPLWPQQPAAEPAGLSRSVTFKRSSQQAVKTESGSRLPQSKSPDEGFNDSTGRFENFDD